MTRFINMILIGSIVFYGIPAFAEVHVLDRAQAEAHERSNLDSPWAFAASGVRLSPSLSPRLYAAADTEMQTEAEEDTGARIELDERISDLEYERDQISTRGPRGAAIAGGVILVAGGVVAAAAALACSQADSGSGTRCRKDRAKDIETVGGIVAGLGLVTLIGGLVALGGRRESQREFDRRILELKEQRTALPENFEARVSLGEAKILTLSWSF